MEVNSVKVRFGPSPTGFLHIGGVRTALYNFLWAKKNNGTFILRIEDTDKERLVDGAIEDIIESIKWLGFDFQGPIFQSKRLNTYKEHGKQLLDKGSAYQEEGAVKFKTPKEGSTSWEEVIGGKRITFENATQDDFVLIKTDGFPTYNFANVVDDHNMEITHVIRGAEFIPSTPKHIMLYRAFNWEPPHFAHIPLILGSDKSKLSKRHGAKPVSDFRKDGYLPDVILNYMALLGWTPPLGKEILSIDEMIKEFDLKDIHSGAAVFDLTKLDWMNGEYIRKMSDEELTKRLQDYLVDHPARDKIAPAVPLIKERIKKLSDFVPLTDFLWEKPQYDKAQFQNLRIKNQKDVIGEIIKRMESMEKPWKADVFEQAFRKLADELGLSATQMFQLIRVAVSGQNVTPPLFESIQILGEEEALKRVKECLLFL